jgi:HAMP domain-containing protein/putative methionine-R-sulfoxide reductase with GAF domain
MTVDSASPRPRAVQPRGRLGTRLAFVLLPLVLVPLALMGGAAYLRAQELVRQQVVSRLSTAAVADTRELQAWILAREERLNLTVQSAAMRQAIDATLAGGPSESLLSSLAPLTTGEQALFSEVMLTGADATVVSATDQAKEGAVLSALQNGTLSPLAIVTIPTNDDPQLSPGSFALVTSVPVRNADDTNAGYLIGISRDQQVMTLLHEMQGFWPRREAFQEDAGYAYLLMRPDKIVRLPEYIFATSPEVLGGQAHPVFDLAEQADAGDAQYVAVSGEPVVGAYEWLGDQDLGLVLEVPQSEVYSGLGSLAPFTVGLIVLAAMVCFVIVLIATDRLLRPLCQLTEFADRISHGVWGHPVPETRDDEIGALASSFNRMADDLSGLYGSLEARVEERTKQVRTAAEVARAVTSTPNLDDLLVRAVELIRDRFGYYHVTIFLLDEAGSTAVVRESTGEVGQLMKARGHSLPVGSPSIIGWVTANNQGRIATDVGRDPIHWKNELLPETRSEAAVPLQVAGRVLGALDVQSRAVNAFSPEALEVLQALADQLSTAIQNARLAQDSAVAAERARLMTAVTGQFSGLMDVERVLETAAQTLHRVLGQPEITITLAPQSSATESGDARS